MPQSGLHVPLSCTSTRSFGRQAASLADCTAHRRTHPAQRASENIGVVVDALSLSGRIDSRIGRSVPPLARLGYMPRADRGIDRKDGALENIAPLYATILDRVRIVDRFQRVDGVLARSACCRDHAGQRPTLAEKCSSSRPLVLFPCWSGQVRPVASWAAICRPDGRVAGRPRRARLILRLLVDVDTSGRKRHAIWPSSVRRFTQRAFRGSLNVDTCPRLWLRRTPPMMSSAMTRQRATIDSPRSVSRSVHRTLYPPAGTGPLLRRDRFGLVIVRTLPLVLARLSFKCVQPRAMHLSWVLYVRLRSLSNRCRKCGSPVINLGKR